MSKKRPKNVESEEKMPLTAKPKRKPLRFDLIPELEEALEKYREDQDTEPVYTKILTVALREFLEKRGYLPPRHNT